PVPGEQPSVR
ncbi:hypothetical protein BN1723_020547, partial [Verticillium longisporum]